MTESQFIEAMDRAILRTESIDCGGWSCNNISYLDPYTRTIRKAYEDLFEFHNDTLVNKLPNEDFKTHKNTRLALLELFKEICLTTKEYENF